MNRAIVGQLNALQIKQKRSTRCNSCFQLLDFDYEMLSRESQLRNFRFLTNLKDNLILRTKQLFLSFIYLYSSRRKEENIFVISILRFFPPPLLLILGEQFNWNRASNREIYYLNFSVKILYEKSETLHCFANTITRVWIKLNKDRLTGIFAFYFRVVKREKASRDRVLEI